VNEIIMTDSKVPCDFVPINPENYHRVQDFRENDRILQFREKLARKEIGYFAEHKGRTVGSIWATINKSDTPMLVRTYINLSPGHALIHDIVTGEKARGLGIGPFMTSRMAKALLEEYGMAEIVVDVSTRNHASNRMMEKIGLRKAEKMFYITLRGGRTFRLLLRKYV
jgi:RimJ/RimL family protein N-acetyltransferase